MRCTQKQFESIKDRINMPIECIDSFNNYPFLTNCYRNGYAVSNTKDLTWEAEYFQTFDAEIFLKACDSWEEEKIWSGSEMQYKNINGKWVSCSFDTEFRIKPQPDYSKEIEALQLKAKENGMKCIINFEKI